jgi:uncharacterized protein YbjT (DUF2867 family)
MHFIQTGSLGNQMRILLSGSSGFIGSHLLRAFISQGHAVTCVVRSLPEKTFDNVRYVVADFSQHTRSEKWIEHLQNIDVVVNAVGIIRESDSQTFDALHTLAPMALFDAGHKVGIRLVVQISALGADQDAASKYHLSKKAADDYLQKRNIASVILQPSLVYGTGGASAALFNTLATMPLLLKFGQGKQMVQPVHVDDLTEAVLLSLDHVGDPVEKIPVVGPFAMTLNEFVISLRKALKLKPPIVLRVPLGTARLAAKILGLFKNSPLDFEMFQMLERGNIADAAAFKKLLQRPPRSVDQFLEPTEITVVRRMAALGWLLPLLRLSIAMVWIVTGIVSFGIYPLSDSYGLLERVGISAWLAPLMLYGAAAFDMAIGIGILCIRKKWIWRIQFVLISFYTAVIAWRLPEFLIHPYGPLLKNLPMLVAIWLMHEWEEK